MSSPKKLGSSQYSLTCLCKSGQPARLGSCINFLLNLRLDLCSWRPSNSVDSGWCRRGWCHFCAPVLHLEQHRAIYWPQLKHKKELDSSTLLQGSSLPTPFPQVQSYCRQVLCLFMATARCGVARWCALLPLQFLKCILITACTPSCWFRASFRLCIQFSEVAGGCLLSCHIHPFF